MAKRFGRNQERKLLELLAVEQRAKEAALRSLDAEKGRLAQVLRDQLAKGVVPLEVEHFIANGERNLIMHAIFDERRANLHYQHAISPHDLKIERDREERERFGLYLGRAIADRIAEAYAGRDKGSSRLAA